jgi:hypothetical protein
LIVGSANVFPTNGSMCTTRRSRSATSRTTRTGVRRCALTPRGAASPQQLARNSYAWRSYGGALAALSDNAVFTRLSPLPIGKRSESFSRLRVRSSKSSTCAEIA